jgi:hypothetical protein
VASATTLVVVVAGTVAAGAIVVVGAVVVVDGTAAIVATVVVVSSEAVGALVDAFGPQPATSAPAMMPNAAVRLSRIEQKLGNLAQKIQGAIVPDRSLPPWGWWSAGEQAATRRRHLDGAVGQ